MKQNRVNSRLIKVILVCCSVIVCTGTFAQNFNEWARQKRTQIRYLVQQIAGLQVYIELGQQGYGIYRDGLTLIGDIKNGEFNLHNDYFASLSAVNPRIANSPKVNDIMDWHRQVLGLNELVQGLELGAEQVSLRKLLNNLVLSSNAYVGQVKLLITEGNYQLKDEERIGRINLVCSEMAELYAFARSLCNEAVLFKRQQAAETKNIDVLRRFHGLN